MYVGLRVSLTILPGPKRSDLGEFDCISQTCLLSCMHIKSGDIYFQWLIGCLFGRKQAVHCHGNLSNGMLVYIGVSQGSCISSLVFLVHLDDASRALKHTEIITFSVDTVTFTSPYSFTTIESI